MADPYTYPIAAKRRKPIALIVGALLVATGAMTVVGLWRTRGWSGVTNASFQAGPSAHAVASAIGAALFDSTFNPWYWGFVVFLTLVQWRWPARPEQRALSVEMAVDAVWFVMGNALQVTVVAVTLGIVTVAYTDLFGTWSLHLYRPLGFWGLAVVAFVLTDALAWVSHWCHHKVPTLWRFHAVHHSQRRLNALSDNRTHVGEIVFAALIVFVPSELLGLGSSAAMRLAFIGIYYCAMLHSNVRTNLGPLRYVFMGPQAHRVHHAVEPRYFEHNFGTVFPWWDFVARTYYWGVDEYPATGITDTAFPLREPGDANPLRWALIFLRQLVYPFRSVFVLWSAQVGAAHAFGTAATRGDAVPGTAIPERQRHIAAYDRRGGRPYRLVGQNYYLDFLSASTARDDQRPAGRRVESSIERLLSLSP